MGGTIPQLQMFPLYPGGPMVRYKNTIAANSFYLPATQFTPAYGVNIGATNRYENDSFSLRSDNTIARSVSSSSSSAYSQSLSFDATVLGGLKKTSIPSIAPALPNIYKQAAELLSISDLKMSELMSQPSFTIPNIGMGLKVTTDGAGGIESVAISPSSRALNPDMSVFNPMFAGANRAEITQGMMHSVTPIYAGPATKPVVSPKKVNPQQLVQQNLNNLAQVPGVSQLERLAGLLKQPFGGDELSLNSLFGGLNQFQPNNGLPVAGFDSMIRGDDARQIAVSQAKLDVVPTEQFKENVARLVSGAVRQPESYAKAMSPQVNMDGRMPVAPSMPMASQQLGQSNAGLANNGFNLGGGMTDATDKKGSGGYIPFQMQSNTQGGSSGQMNNPFMAAGQFTGQPRQQNQEQKRLRTFVA